MRMTKLRQVPALTAAVLSVAMLMAALTCEATAGSSTTSEDAADPPHPLAARYPGNLVVVCEAGCSRHRGPQIVFMERAPKRKMAVQGMMQPTSARLDDAPAAGKSAVIECLAGCYDTPKFYSSPIVSTKPAATWKPTMSDTAPGQRGPFSPIR
jgi:hypothetical protein